MKDKIFELAREFSSESHGSSTNDKEQFFVMGENEETFIPFSQLIKKIPEIKDVKELQSFGFMISAQDFLECSGFEKWFEKQFNKKLFVKEKKNIFLVHFPDQKKIFDAVEVVNDVYENLKIARVIMNGKNLPVQLGEWYAKMIFGLRQVKSSSQRGFDFQFDDGKTVEVKIHWHDATSPKGVKIKKSLAELSDYIIIMYVAKNFMIRDILFLDSDFVLRKFDTKGHTIFLKDGDVSGYFFSRSDKHFDKIVNKSALMKFAAPTLAMKLDGRL